LRLLVVENSSSPKPHGGQGEASREDALGDLNAARQSATTVRRIVGAVSLPVADRHKKQEVLAITVWKRFPRQKVLVV